MAALRGRLLVGTLLLMISVWIRTDNVLVLLAVLTWLVWGRKLKAAYAGVLALLAIASVKWINTLSGNYGWKVLLHYSFVGGRYPAQITSGITVTQYVQAFLVNAESILPQIAPYLLLGVITWEMGSKERDFLIPVLTACTMHYLLFPSGEARYMAWACIVTGILFIRSVRDRKVKSTVVDRHPQAIAAA